MNAWKSILASFPFAVRALMLITSFTYFLSEVDPPSKIRYIKTDSRWNTLPTPETSHLSQLLSFGLVVMLGSGLVRGVSTYFAISKSDGTARSIFNARWFSLRCKTPPSTNLPDVVQVLLALEELFRDCRTPTLLEGDFRHYFHQLPLEKDISSYFCLNFAHVFYRWTSLPMGWSYSPFIAQAIGMGTILTTLERCGCGVSEYKELDTPPSMVILRDNKGKSFLVAALWYDNILVQQLSRTWQQKFLQNSRPSAKRNST